MTIEYSKNNQNLRVTEPDEELTDAQQHEVMLFWGVYIFRYRFGRVESWYGLPQVDSDYL